MSKSIEIGSRVSLHFELKLSDGSVAESSYHLEQPPALEIGGGTLTESFERCLLGMSPGEKGEFELKAAQAFGLSNPDHVQYFHLSQFGPETPVAVGSVIAFTQPNGTEVPGVIREIEGESVTVDFNHPLAGQDVQFNVEIFSVEKD